MTLSPTTNDPLIGKILAERYRITELVGSGRFSIVYKGQHLFMDRAVAMKTLQSNLVEDETIIKRFEKEAVALSKLRHPNIVSVYDCFVHTNGQPFLVMDFLDGHTLEELLTERGAIPPKLMRAIVFQASAGLAHAHGSGVLHRDIKPDNIILLPREKTDERVRLLDFGFALLQGDLERLTLSGTLCGSPAYISPERWKGKELDARSDIYSLAVVMFQGLTGQLPFKASSLEDLRNMHVLQDPPLLGEVLPALKDDQTAQQIVSKAMAKDPEDRYQTMKDFHNAIKLWAPNSDDAEIAQWAKNAAPKPSPKVVPPGQPTLAQPISLQPMPPQPVAAPVPQPAAQPQLQQQQAQPPDQPHEQSPGNAAQSSFAAPGSAQNWAASGPAFDEAATVQNKPTGPTFDEIETLQERSAKPAFDDVATLPMGQTAQESQPEGQSFIEHPNSANTAPSQPAETLRSNDLDDHPLSPESIARVTKPNPRASLTKQDVAYIKAIAQTLGDSLGDQAKAIEITPELEEELHMAPRDETSRLDFSAMPKPVVQSTVPEPGPKIVPVVDRRAKRSSEEAAMGDEVQSLTSSANSSATQLPAQPPASAPAGGAQPVPSDWSVKQEVAPWVTSPDEFKPKAGVDAGAPGQPVDGWGGAAGSQAAAQASTQPDSPNPAPGQPATPNPPGSPSPFGSPTPFGAPGAFGAPAASNPSGPPATSGPPASFGAPPQFGQLAQLSGQPNSSSPPGAPQQPGSLTSGSTSSSRISPVLPGSPAASNAPGQPGSESGSTLGSPASPSAQVPWSSSPSSAPVDFGKMFGDTDKTIVTSASIAASKPPSPGVPQPGVPPSGIGSPSASASNLSVSAGNDSAQSSKKDKKRNRLPTFVDRQISENESGEGQPTPKKGGMGMVVAGIAAAIFVFAGIGIATWMITNVNPSTSLDQGTSPPNVSAPAKTAAPPAHQSPAQAPTASAPSTDNNKDATTGATNSAGSDATAATADNDKQSTDASRNKGTDSTAKAPSVDTTAKDKNADTTANDNATETTAKAPSTKETPKSAELTSKAAAKSAPPAVKEQPKEAPSATGWFGMPTFNQEYKPKPPTVKPEAAPPVTAIEETPHAPPKPHKKKPKHKKPSVAHSSGAAASSGGDYVEVEVTPGRRAYRSY